MPESDGSGITVAVIDSGVHPDHPHILATRLLPGLALGRDGAITEDGAIPLDRLGHGTAVCAAIQEKAPGAAILPIRVFDDALRTSPLALVMAIEAAMARGAHIINLSLGTTNMAHHALFARASASAQAQGITLIAAASAGGEACLPGCLPDVIGAEVDWDIPREAWRWDEGRIVASGYPRPIPGVAPRRNLYGISFAVAQASGFAAIAAQSCGPDPRAIAHWLANNAPIGA